MYRTSHDQPAPIVRTLATELRAARLKRKWTQAQLAKKAKLPIRCIQRCETGGGSGEKLIAAFGALGLEIVPPPQPRQHAYTIAWDEVREPTWFTPPHVLDAVLRAFRRDRFCLDVASPDPPTVPCERFYTKDDDGLAQPWNGDLVWANPPYDEKPGLRAWIEKGVAEYRAKNIRCLCVIIPNRGSTSGHRLIRKAGAAIFEFHSRLKFGGRKSGPETNSLLYVLGATDGELEQLETTLPPHDCLSVRSPRTLTRG